MTTQITNSIQEQIIEIIMNQMHLPKDVITLEAEFEADLGFDSLEQVDFIMTLEEIFNIEVPDEDAEQIRSVQQAISRVEQCMKN